MYLDESGDHTLAKIDPTYPVFVLGGIIVDRTYARTVLEPRVRAFKANWFGSHSIVLHSTDGRLSGAKCGASMGKLTAMGWSRCHKK
jgi:hypothetical protein